MKSSPDSSFIFTADTLPFSDTATLVTVSDGTAELSLFSVPTEIAPQSMDEIKPAAAQPLADAPENELYTITHEIGAGGYGSIWYGVQTKLKRRVALKSLKSEAVNKHQYEQMARLFRQEALTTAYLQHPNVVPVYDLAEDTKGRPIVAMKLVEGRQWNRVLAEDFAAYSPLEFLERHLPVLISVAQAVAFAHSRGIIHRDLKPSQVMIGSYGEVLLMDWGLAMAARDADGQIFCDPAIIVDALSPLLKPLLPAGTPGYMAPEQTQKDASKLGPWTDVYLMGAILYELLTGYRPHSGSRQNDPFQGARENKTSRPEVCTPDRDIPAQLSALAVKAMATKPSNRVSSASAFVAELKDYLIKAGRRGESMTLVTEVANSVIAEEPGYQHLQLCLDKLDRALAQWPENQMATYLRHQVLVTFARTSLNNHDLKLARFQAERIHLCHERSNILKEISAAEQHFNTQDLRMSKANSMARGERERAEALIRFLLLDLQNELRSAGRADLIFKVATEALTFFDSLQDEEISTQTLYKRCLAYQQIGNVLAEHGRRVEADTAYNRALDLTETLIKIAPDKGIWINLKAECLQMLGNLHYSMGRLDIAAQELNKALAIQQKLKADVTDQPSRERSIAMTLHDIAAIYWREQDLDKAFDKISESIATARKRYETDPTNPEIQSDLASFITTLAHIHRDMGNLDEATKLTYEALAFRIALSEQFPGVSSRAEDVYWVRSALGMLQILSGDLEAALDNLKHDVAARRRIFEENMVSVVRNFGITFQLSLLAEVTFLLGRSEDAEHLLSECLVHSRQLAQTDESNPTAVSGHAHHLVQMAELLASQGRWREAERLVNQAVERARYSYWLSSKNSVVFRPLCRSLALAARIARREGKRDEAQQLLFEASDIYNQISGRRCPAEHQALAARLHLETSKPSESQALLDRLAAKRRLDPYINEWAKELKLT